MPRVLRAAVSNELASLQWVEPLPAPSQDEEADATACCGCSWRCWLVGLPLGRLLAGVLAWPDAPRRPMWRRPPCRRCAFPRSSLPSGFGRPARACCDAVEDAVRVAEQVHASGEHIGQWATAMPFARMSALNFCPVETTVIAHLPMNFLAQLGSGPAAAGLSQVSARSSKNTQETNGVAHPQNPQRCQPEPQLGGMFAELTAEPISPPPPAATIAAAGSAGRSGRSARSDIRR